MGPGGSREALEAQKSLPGRSRGSKIASRRLRKLRRPKKGQKWLKMQHFQWFWGLPWGGPGRKVTPPREANEVVFGARGETTEGGT